MKIQKWIVKAIFLNIAVFFLFIFSFVFLRTSVSDINKNYLSNAIGKYMEISNSYEYFQRQFNNIKPISLSKTDNIREEILIQQKEKTPFYPDYSIFPSEKEFFLVSFSDNYEIKDIYKLRMAGINALYKVMTTLLIIFTGISMLFIFMYFHRFKNSEKRDDKNPNKELASNFSEMVDLSSKLIKSATENNEKYLSDLLNFSLKLFPEADCGSISLIEGDKIRYVETVGHDIDKLKKINLKKEYISNSEKNTLIVDKVLDKNKKTMPYPVFIGLKKASKPIKQSLISKLRIGNNHIGNISLDISNEKNGNFSKDSISLIEGISNIISAFYAVRKNLTFKGKVQKNLILSMISMLEIYDSYTKGHSENVAELAKNIAYDMNLDETTLEEVYWAGLVHDIGKLLIPTNILNKPGKLTSNEFDVIKMHPIWGYSVLQKSEDLEDISVYVRNHHERWDGEGYPDKLKYENIPLVSRIIAVADAYDAMTSNRSYRKGIDSKDALKEIKNGAGTQFDPYIVDIFLKMMV